MWYNEKQYSVTIYLPSTSTHYVLHNQSLSNGNYYTLWLFYKTSNEQREEKKLNVCTNKRLKVVLNGFHARNLSNWNPFHVFVAHFFLHFYFSNRVIVETKTIETLNLSSITMKIVQWKALFVCLYHSLVIIN